MYDEGKYFYIQSCLNDLVLDIKGGDISHGQEVVLWDYHGGENQLWFEDKLNGVIRCRADEELVLHVDGDTLQVQTFGPDDYNQRWQVTGNTISHCDDSSRVLDIADCCEDPGARVCAWSYNGGDNQHWTITYLPPRRFYIVSELNGRVLDVKRNDPSPGTKAVTWDRNDEQTDNQLWFEDKYGIIHSCLNDLVLDTTGDVLRMEEYDTELGGRQWQKVGHRILNRFDRCQCLDIKAAKDKNGAKVISWEFNGSANQCWNFEYIE